MDRAYLEKLVDGIYEKLNPNKLSFNRSALNLIETDREHTSFDTPEVNYASKIIVYRGREISLGYEKIEGVEKIIMRVYGNQDLALTDDEELKLKVLLERPHTVSINPKANRTHKNYVSKGDLDYSGVNSLVISFDIKRMGKEERVLDALWFMSKPVFKTIMESKSSRTNE